MFDIITIGSITKDNFLEIDCEIINWPKTPSKKALVFPFGEKLEVKKIVCTLGGNSANASITFSRLGFKTACFGKIGDDLAGREIKSFLKKEKVSPIFAVAKNSITAQSTLLLSKGERTILGYHGSSSKLNLKDIPWNKLKSKWWYLSLAGESIRLFKPMLKFAKKNGIKVAFNPSGFHIKHRKKEILEGLKDIDFLVLNEGEAANLVGISFEKEKEVFKRLDDLMPGIVAVTNGPKGVTVSDGKHIFKAGIFKEKLVADRTGAGDAFGSGFTAGLIKYKYKDTKKEDSIKTITNAIKLASANATSVVEYIGTTPGIIKKGEFNKPRFKNLKIKIHPIK
jgi:ribokinase